MIELAILIQSLFFINKEKHTYIVLFIVIASIIMMYTNNLLFLGILIVIIQLIYIWFDNDYESFKRRRRRRRKPRRPRKPQKKLSKLKKPTSSPIPNRVNNQVKVAKKKTNNQVKVAKKKTNNQVKYAKKRANKMNPSSLVKPNTKSAGNGIPTKEEPEEDLNNMETNYEYNAEEEKLMNRKLAL